MFAKQKTDFMLKVSALLLLVSFLFLLLSGITFCRFLTEKEEDVSFSAQRISPIYLNDTAIFETALYRVTQWEEEEGSKIASFTLENTQKDQTPPTSDMKFLIRIVIAEQEALLIPKEVIFSVGEKELVSNVEQIEENTSFYQKNQKNGKIYFFSDEAGEGKMFSEYQFCLKGNQKDKIDIQIKLPNVEMISDRFYICIDRVK